MSGSAVRSQSLIPGAGVTIAEGVLHAHSARPLRVLSSASCGGAWLTAHDVLNVHVSKSYVSDAPEEDLRRLAVGRGIAGPFVGLLTAAYVERAGVATRVEGGLAVACVATVGVGNATCAGREVPWVAPGPAAPGTINLIVLVDADVAPEAMVNLVITATEAKALTLAEGGLRTASGLAASGTSTDAVVIACTGEGPRLRYAGPATQLGHLVACCVREAMGLSWGATPVRAERSPG